MPAAKNEMSHYPEIRAFIGEQLTSNFRAAGAGGIEVFWAIGELKANLARIIAGAGGKCDCARTFARTVPPLNLDIFALITDGSAFQTVILEVKRLPAAGLKEWSQLVGYCLVSGAKYGILINIDNEASPRLAEILKGERPLSDIKTISAGGAVREHCLGFMKWDSLAKSFDYTNLGAVTSLSELSRRLLADFQNPDYSIKERDD